MEIPQVHNFFNNFKKDNRGSRSEGFVIQGWLF